MKKRKFKIDRVSDRVRIQSIIDHLGMQEGVISVDMDRRKKILRLKYDLRKIKLATIEKWLQELEIVLSPGFVERFKRGMAKFTEQNELDHLNAPLSSCCEDPKANGRDCKNC